MKYLPIFRAVVEWLKCLKRGVSVFCTKAGYNSFLIRSRIPNKRGWLCGEKRKYSFCRTCHYVTTPFCLLDADCIITGLCPDTHMNRQFYKRFPNTSCSGVLFLKKRNLQNPPPSSHTKNSYISNIGNYAKCKIEASSDICNLKPSQMVIQFKPTKVACCVVHNCTHKTGYHYY